MTFEARALGSLVQKVDNSGPASGTEAFTYIDLSSINAETKVVTRPKFIAIAEAPSRARQRLNKDDVLVSTVRPNLNGVAQVGAGLDHSIASTGFCVLRPIPEVLDARYLFNWVKSPVFVREMTRLATGASYPAVSDSTIKASLIPLPPLPEQRRIAEILDRADELRAKRSRALALLDELAQSTFVEMFGFPSGSDQRWVVGTVRDLLESAKYGSSGKAGPVGEFPILRMGNITQGGQLDLTDMKYIDLSEAEKDKYLVRRGDILFNRTNSVDLVGKTAIVDVDNILAFAGYLVRLRVKPEHRPEYLGAFLNSAYAKVVLRKMAKSIVGMANINAQEIQDVKIPIPPRSLQDLFAEKIASIAAAKKTHLEHLAKLDELFASLQRRAFAGQL